ncbi:uncharacterized protein LOC116198531 isoform X2 [Punica granatum]|uniref:Uncharacterized protein LOC116198531 isoform X2 n=1 Tax=Punica granatum TaxID=22663 RepID=A0A6P8CYR2_PUNGR|nr:uncharacterized protein LOC116198531 isoform X2 [Punica granatum]
MAAPCDKSFSNSYLLLRPEDVGLVDLFRILFSTNLEQRKFVDSSHDTEESFNQRWIIFISIIVQKLLLSMAKPMAWVGSTIELWLNLVRINGGSLGSLLLNFIRGNAVMPDKTSADFLSLIGNIDRRMDFDKKNRPGDEKYYAHLALMSSKASYENEAFLKYKVTDIWKVIHYQEKATTQGFMLRDKNLHGDTIVVAFRGTEPFDSDSWCSDFDISWYELPGMGRMHGGFMKALGLQRNLGWPKESPAESDTPRTSHPPTAYYFIREKLRSLLQEDSHSRYIVTGHSLGGALAVLFPAILSLHEENELLDRLEGVYTFGQPRVGDGAFGKFMQKVMSDHKIEYHRFVYGNDIVPRLPYDNSSFLFKHFWKCRYYDSHYGEQILPEEPNKNYFSLRSALPMMVTAIYELMRSFTIVSMKGPEYRESTVLRILRVIGLLVPGIPAHSLMDYNNSIRLGLAYRDITIKEKDS